MGVLLVLGIGLAVAGLLLTLIYGSELSDKTSRHSHLYKNIDESIKKIPSELTILNRNSLFTSSAQGDEKKNPEVPPMDYPTVELK